MAELIHQQIEAAAKVLAEGMDYPWEPMPELGRKNMRALAIRVVEAALSTNAGEAAPVANAAGEAFNNMFHKCRAEVSMDWWQRIWIMAVRWAWENPQSDAQPTLRSALNGMLTQFGMDEDEWNKPTFDQARRALAHAPAAVHGQSASTETPAGWLDLQDDPRVNEIVSGLYRRFKDWSQRGFSAEDVTWCEVKADVIRLIAATPPAAIPPPGEAMALGQAVARWTGGEYTAYRTDNGEPEQWLKVSVERLGFAIAALAAIPAAPMTDAQIVSAAKEAGLSEFIGFDRAELGHELRRFARAVAALAQRAPVQQEAVALMHIEVPSGEMRVWPDYSISLSTGAKTLPAGFHKLYAALQPTQGAKGGA